MKDKYKRIQYLKTLGYNTPRMFFIDMKEWLESKDRTESYLRLREFMRKHLGRFDTNYPQCDDRTPVNIRTYTRDELKGWLSTHYTETPFWKVYDIVRGITDTHVCMVDLETPTDGILSGNIGVTIDLRCTQEFIWKPEGGAMVRQADKSIGGWVTDTHLKDLPELGLPQEDLGVIQAYLLKIRHKAMSFPLIGRRDVILEWSIFKNPAGIHGVHDIWWEYRAFK
jgi:hypothetical protein